MAYASSWYDPSTVTCLHVDEIDIGRNRPPIRRSRTSEYIHGKKGRDSLKGTPRDQYERAETQIAPEPVQAKPSILMSSCENSFDVSYESTIILPTVPTSREEDMSTRACGFAYLGCQYQDASWDRDDWLSHIIDHFKDTPSLSDANCHLCEESFETPTDTHIKNIWSDRLGHCWQHIQERALKNNDLSPFLQPGRLLYCNGTSQIFRSAFPNPNGTGQIFRNLVTLKDGQIYDGTKTIQKLWLDARKEMILSRASKLYPNIEASFSRMHLDEDQKDTTLTSLGLPFREAPHSGQHHGSHYDLLEGKLANRNDNLNALPGEDLKLGTLEQASEPMADQNKGEVIVKREVLDGVGGEITALPPLSQSSTRASMTETTSSQWEEETDWDGESSFGSCLDQTSLPSHSFIYDEGRSSAFQHQFTSVQHILIERMMAEFWIIFDHRWQAQPRQRGQTPPSSQHNQSQSSEEHATPSSYYMKQKSTKRARSNDNENSDNERDRPSKRKGKEKESVDPSEVPIRYACPYRKRNPKKYSVQTWRTCALTPHTSVARLKAHLYKYHSINQCPRCKQLFNNEKILEAHTLAPESCTVREADPVDGITNKMRGQLHNRKKLFPDETEADRWNRVYKIIFCPEVGEKIPSPYFEPIQESELHPSLSPESQAFMEYEGHFRRELPRHFRQIIEAAVSHEMQPIEEGLRRQFMEFLEEAQKRTFSSFREKFTDQNASSGDENKAFDKKSDDEQPGKGPESAAMLETFFDPPPPAENEFVSLPLLSQSSRHFGAENWSNEDKCFHDSAYASSSTQLAIGNDMQDTRWNGGTLSSNNGESSSMGISAPRSDQDHGMKYRNVEVFNVGASLTYEAEALATGSDLINEVPSMDDSWAVNFDTIDIEHELAFSE